MNKKCIHEPRTQKTNIIQNNTNPKSTIERPVFSQRVVFVELGIVRAWNYAGRWIKRSKYAGLLHLTAIQIDDRVGQANCRV